MQQMTRTGTCRGIGGLCSQVTHSETEVEAMAKGHTAYIVLQLVTEPEDGQIAAYCPDLDVATCGDTRDEAIANLTEAVTLHLNALTSHGEILNELKERGIELRFEVPDELNVHGDVRPGGSVMPITLPVPQLIYA